MAKSNSLYTGLDYSTSEIRLLSLHPYTPGPDANASEEYKIVCSFQTHSIEEAPSYEALSYAWHEDTAVQEQAELQYQSEVWIKPLQEPNEPRKVTVTPNLFAALRALRPTTQDVSNKHTSLHRILWVDALCIDQSNTAEKNHQVRFMRTIYQCASKTIIWLGPANPCSEVISKAVRHFRTCMPRRLLLSRDENFLWMELHIPFKKSHKEWLATLPYTLEELCTHSLDFLNTRAWFTRVWIVQEAVVSAQIELGCGQEQILKSGWPLDWLSLFIMALRLETSQLPRAVKLKSSLKAIRLSRGYINTNTRANLGELLRDVRSCKASDPRDKVFAILGIVSDAKAAFPDDSLDYDRSVSSIYTQAARFLFDHENNLRVLCEALDTREVNKDLPSWVPDWSQAPWELSFGGSLNFAKWRRLSSDRLRRLHLEFNPSELCIAGLYHSTILDTSEETDIERTLRFRDIISETRAREDQANIDAGYMAPRKWGKFREDVNEARWGWVSDRVQAGDKVYFLDVRCTLFVLRPRSSTRDLGDGYEPVQTFELVGYFMVEDIDRQKSFSRLNPKPQSKDGHPADDCPDFVNSDDSNYPEHKYEILILV